MADVRAKDDIFFTKTMAEVLERQGRLEDALVIYKILADSRPGDETIARSIERLEAMAEKAGRKGRQ